MMPWSSTLLTDLYELTMAHAYLQHGMEQPAVFEFFVRKLPARRQFLIAAGLEQVIEFLLQLRLTDEEVRWLESTGRFAPALLDYLRRLRFAGDVEAVPEGTIFFPHEPILRITAPLPVAQLVESRVMNLLNFQTMIASKAARSVLVAGGKPLIDFGLRRAHGAEAGLLAARASYLAGFAGTATVLAGMAYGIPLYGTMAHSFVQAHQDEAAAFAHFAESQPDNILLLIDTYDTEEAARKVVRLAPALRARGLSVKGVRLDSGDLGDHARKVRRILDDGGLTNAQILASGNLDEYRLKELVDSGAPIDSFAIGTAMTTSSDAPSLDCAYKLQAYAGRPCRKRSEGKATWPGAKQVYRHYDDAGQPAFDVVTTASDRQTGTRLLESVVKDGRRVAPAPSLDDIRRLVATQLTQLPARLRTLEQAPPYEVRIAPALQELAQALDQNEPALVTGSTQGDRG
ncbi:nicotinate phosphoribosyltransferase [Nitrospira moscoviensis]|uniref:Nicotinate phosphoribosyltransferase n=1 Tax=Nitrospira moscoviensis TaxID=42253 RepID=A0A0K2GH92_NITMO|nr:nicotinate phosphoribosyltransferase [Nitrospira moscoviensis]ALA60224.1 Nicotinate phosphoribosyltransferase pncB2 [Nitrospira moscoviensis]